MKKSIILALFTPLMMMGQMFKSPNQQFVEQAIKGGIFIIRQTYQLEDTVTKQRFGRYGNDEFGAATYLSIRTTDGYIIDTNVLSPWETDNNFSRYRNSHKPVLSRSYSMEIGDSVMKLFSFSLDSINFKHRKLSLLCPADSSSGFCCKSYKRPTEGWVVWLSNDSTINEYRGLKAPELTIYRRTVEFHPDSITYAIDAPNTTNKIWGGIFVVPEQVEIGLITFYLGGAIVKDVALNKWVIVPLTKQCDYSFTRPEDELTPLNEIVVNKRKNKTNNKK